MKIKIRTIRLIYCPKRRADVEVDICFVSNCPLNQGIKDNHLFCGYELKDESLINIDSSGESLVVDGDKKSRESRLMKEKEDDEDGIAMLFNFLGDWRWF